MNPQPHKTAETSYSSDFDFLIGNWRVHHRRLVVRLAQCNDWQEFSGTSQMRLNMGGQGNIDDNYIDLPGGAYRAVTLRSYDPKTQTWAIWWLDARNPHVIEPPVIGKFTNGIGIFECDDIFNGRPIWVRFTWSRITATTCHWEQAFSPDGGQTWETNWIMDFTRA